MGYENEDMSFRIPKEILKIKQQSDCPNSQDVDCWDVPLNSLQFHSSWDWLMPVVSKITTNENYIDLTQRENIMDSLPYGMVEDTYDEVVEFIKWYNKNNKLISEFMSKPYGYPKGNEVSWDWLMPVIQKIGDDILNTPFDETYSRLTEGYENIWTKEDTYLAVVEFIKWYNEQ